MYGSFYWFMLHHDIAHATYNLLVSWIAMLPIMCVMPGTLTIVAVKTQKGPP
jgi:hypothetical protein